ncbi:kelch-like protein diablo [Exaiptasia diaphana]|uniref:BTB domain-containing protein n=1 Tax=Exaiptasia diaphana TaxID=2652724 RepID=A0A913X8Q0_EXADI|nr:kelch-like protein diablo [Exaiptasia diaphana]
MSASKDGVEEAFTRLDKERLLEITYLNGGGRTFRGDRQNFLSFLNVLRKEGESGFCDVVLEVDGQSFPAHRCVLAANSQFFYTLFTSGMRDSNEKHIKLCSLSSSALSTILDFFYTRDIVVNKDNAEELLEAASFLLLNHVKNACATIISSNLSISNCFSTKRLADRYALDELKRKADSFMKENFQAAKQQKEFLDLEPYEVKELISSDSVRVEKEEEVFEAILNWVKHDPSDRTKELSILLPCLRYGSLSPKFLEEQFEKDPIFEDNSFCQNFLKQQRRRRRSARSNKQPMSKERPSARIHDVVIGVGRGNLRTSFCYDIQSELIYKLPDPPSPFFQLGAAAIGRELYTICRDRHDWDDNATSLMKHKLGSNNRFFDRFWVEINESLLKPNVCYDKAIVLPLKEKLYVLGGCMSFENRTVDMQCYDPNEGEWKAMAKMNTSRCMIGAVATNSYIYAIGGKKSHVTVGEKLVERYNPEANEWTSMADMFYIRVNPQVVATSNGIFAIGGLTGTEPGYCCEVYKESSDKWTLIPALPNRIPKISLSLNDEVYVISGGQSWKYSKKKDLWKKSPMFRSLLNGFDDFHFVQLKLPKFCYEQYYRIAAHSLVRYNRSYYDCSSDDDDESDYQDPWFFWGDDSSESEW